MGRVHVATLMKKGIARERIDVIPHGLLDHYIFGPPSTRGEELRPTILFFGRITEYKGLGVLLEAFEQVAIHRPQVQLKIVGEGNLKPYSDQLDRIPNVSVVNRWVDEAEVGNYFQNAAMLAIPYTSASQSGVVAIAAAFGTPVVATRVGALPEQIENDQTGLLVEPNSPDQLSKAMIRLLDDPDLSRSVGRNLAERTRKSSDWDTIAGSFIESCRKAISIS
jgi:glycosyltransferase involved in cell wall biosynthesis